MLETRPERQRHPVAAALGDAAVSIGDTLRHLR
jgi:hypothetical protein